MVYQIVGFVLFFAIARWAVSYDVCRWKLEVGRRWHQKWGVGGLADATDAEIDRMARRNEAVLTGGVVGIAIDLLTQSYVPERLSSAYAASMLFGGMIIGYLIRRRSFQKDEGKDDATGIDQG